MASINHLEMCDQLKALPEIEIKKTCFGLFTQAVYKPSQSVIKVNQHEYSVEVGGQLENCSMVATTPLWNSATRARSTARAIWATCDWTPASLKTVSL